MLILCVLIWVLAVPLTVLIHELGHLAAARAVGWRRMIRFAVYPLCIDWLPDAEGRLRPHFNILFRGRAGASGHCCCLPDREGRPNLTEKRIYLAGGVTLGLLVSGAALLAAFPLVGLYDVLAFSLRGFAVVGILLNLSALFPNGAFSDGQCLLDLSRPTPQAEQACAVAMIPFYLRLDPRLEKLPPWLLESLTYPQPRRRLALLGGDVAYYYALSQGRIEDARRYLAQTTRIAEGWAKGFVTTERNGDRIRANVALERAYFAARFDGDIAAARELFEKAKAGRAQGVRGRALTAILLAEGKTREAAGVLLATEAALKKAEKKMPRLAYTYAREVIHKDVRTMQAEVGEALKAAVPA